MLDFRAASASDCPLLRELAERIWRDSYATMISREQIDYMLGWMYSEEIICREIAQGVVWEIVRIDGEDAGFFSMTFEKDAIAKLNKLYLLPEMQGCGHGHGVLARVFALAIERGAREVRLQVNKSNTRAQRAYEKSGFVKIAEGIFDIGGGFVMDDYIFARKIESK